MTVGPLRVIIYCYMDGDHLYEHNGVKIIILGALQVEIINIHVFTHHPGLVHPVLHIKLPGFLFYIS